MPAGTAAARGKPDDFAARATYSVPAAWPWNGRPRCRRREGANHSSNTGGVDECDLCGIETAHAVVDHCHECGTIRGRLCRRCNRVLDWSAVVFLQVPGYGIHNLLWRPMAVRYMEASHYPGKACVLASIRGVAYRHWNSAGRPWDWRNTYSYWEPASGW